MMETLESVQTGSLAQTARAPRVRLAVAMLTLCCLCWGLSFPVMQFGMAGLKRAMPSPTQEGGPGLAMEATFNGWRLGLSALLYGLLTFPRQRGYSSTDWRGGVLVGLFFGGGMFMQLTALRFVLPSVSAFVTSLYVVLVPLGQSLLFRKSTSGRTWIAIFIALAGMSILAKSNPGASAENTLAVAPPVPWLGEILTVLGSILFTSQILAVDRYGKTADPIRLTGIMLAVGAAVNILGGLALGGGEIYSPSVISTLLHDGKFLTSMAALVLLCSVIAMHLMNAYQPFVPPATACVIYCLEPVFATLWSAGFRTERLTAITIVGGAVILAAVLLVARQPQPASPQDPTNAPS